MQIIILGAGQVGSSLAESLAAEHHSITIVDSDEERLNQLQELYDIRTVTGYCSYPNILAEAGADNADMIIAVTDNDEANLVACQVAYSLYNTPTKIARIRSQDYFIRQELFSKEHLPVDVFISPEQLVTHHIQRLIEHPGTLQVLDFANGLAKLVVVQPFYGGPLLGKQIVKLPDYLPDVDAQLVAMFRKKDWVELSDSTVIEIGDELFFVVADQHVPPLMKLLRRSEGLNQNIMIAGGGNIGSCLAQTLESDYRVKLIDQNRKRCEMLSQKLDQAIIFCGNGCDTKLLNNENIEETDVFCALTNDDEDNIIACLQAKRMGAKQVIALITRPAYVDLIESGTININIAISPQLSTVSSILTHIRQGDMVNVHSVRRGKGEAIEVVAHGDKDTSKVVGRQLQQIKLPKGVKIGAIIRKNAVITPKASSIVQSEDHVILFVPEKKHVKHVERLFQVSAGFF